MGRFFWGAVLGGVAGSFAALMLAKKTGKETRDDLSKKYRQAKDSGDRLINDLTIAKQDLLAKARNLAYDTRDTAKQILKDTKTGRRTNNKRTKTRSKRKNSRP